eukprot:scaffold28117_cov64-Phaeocystis_antarctica.AAC.14
MAKRASAIREASSAKSAHDERTMLCTRLAPSFTVASRRGRRARDGALGSVEVCAPIHPSYAHSTKCDLAVHLRQSHACPTSPTTSQTARSQPISDTARHAALSLRPA